MLPARPRAHELRIGCSGWNYAHWRNGVFYPPRCPARLWLDFYARAFDTVELNTTFYRLPPRDAVARWVEATPAGFVFAVKASRYLTHVKRLRDTGVHLPLLYERLEPLRRTPKLGPILWQLPPTFRADLPRLAEALAALPPGERHAFEFRHVSWFADGTYDLLREHGAALAIADRPEVHGFQSRELTADFTYVRFHHGSRGLRGNYSPRELDAWAAQLSEWAAAVDVYAYFNNDWEGFAVRNARSLRERLAR